MKQTVLYISKDSASRSVGSDKIATRIAEEAKARNLDITIVRTGTRGALWLEPIVEVLVGEKRIAFGPVSVADISSLFDAHFLNGGDHSLLLGPTDEIEWLAKQDRFTFSRVGVVDPLSTSDYEQNGGLQGLKRALELSADERVAEVMDSGLRGRGGAGFPSGIKWRTVAQLIAPVKYICCNADEGDSGTFADRILMEGDPFTLIEGMTIAAVTVGATEGVIYIRSEYPEAVASMTSALHLARQAGWLGKKIIGSEYDFDIRIRVGAGSYVCGEETAMLESIEGKRGVVRSKPPLPAMQGLFGKPTVINNVLTFATVPAIFAHGAKSYAEKGVGRSLGTQIFQLGGNVARGGIVELAFGTTLEKLLYEFGGGTRNGKEIRAVQIGGPLGAYFPKELFDVSMDYESLLAAGGMLGHGGIVVFDESVDMAEQAKFAMEFCALESCGKCTPCRLGSTRGAETIEKIVHGIEAEKNKKLLLNLLDVMTDGSLCAMGGLTPLPVRSAMIHFAQDFEPASQGAQR
ncbi:MAG: NADH-ubiquinone oxidoreductase-F iron-sulfur binding region domain-containing protein [Actinomycetota bacterium]